jgi:hypothetical protein
MEEKGIQAKMKHLRLKVEWFVVEVETHHII